MRDVVERAKELLEKVFDPEPLRYMGARGTIRELILEVERLRRGHEPGCDGKCARDECICDGAVAGPPTEDTPK